MNEAVSKPLEGLLVLDFSQFLSGPSAGLRLADMGARVIKIENPAGGDLCRRLYISNLRLDGDSTLFHSINRNKASYAADMKSEADRQKVRKLLERADVVIQNFRPGVSERLGLNYEAVQAVNPRLVYASITGYGTEGPLVGKPGQDLLVQSLTGLPWLNRSAYTSGPVPFGLAIADMIAGAHLVQGILACLIRRGVTGQGARVEVSLLESTLDAMTGHLTNYLNAEAAPQASGLAGTDASGIYAAADGFIALANLPAEELVQAITAAMPELRSMLMFADFDLPDKARAQEEAVLRQLAAVLAQKRTDDWLSCLTSQAITCEEVFTWERLVQHDGFKVLNMVQDVYRQSGAHMRTLRCPIRFDGRRYYSPLGSPTIGEHNEAINKEFGLAEDAASAPAFSPPGSPSKEPSERDDYREEKRLQGTCTGERP